MARRLEIGLHDGGSIGLQADAPEEAIAFDGLAELLHLKTEVPGNSAADAVLNLPDAMPEGRHTLRSTALTEIAYAPDWSRILIAGWKKQPRRRAYYCLCLWQTALVCAGMHAALRGEKAVLAHCAVLETGRGAVLLFGESGMGKSTAARWRAYGGKCVSDDMALLDFSGGDGQIRVRRMPTWSACREGKNKGYYPSSEELPTAGLLVLGRSGNGRDGIVNLSTAQFFAQCYRSLFYWILSPAKDLPEEKQRLLADRIRKQTELITDRFAPRALLAALDGNLPKLIEDAL